MNALEALHTRVSAPRLTEPGPNAEELRNIYKAALRAADHGLLRPWRFLVIEGDSRHRLGDLFLKAALEKDPELSEAQQEKIRNKPLRAPLLIVTIAIEKEHPKVPSIEMDLSAGAATQNMLVAAYAQHIGAMWRTGSMAFNKTVNKGLGLQDSEKIIGFLYLGTVAGPLKPICEEDVSSYFEEW